MLVAISGPSGSGKTTLLKALRDYGTVPLRSYTTRTPRASEEAFTEQTFISDEEFDELIASGELLWHDRPFGRPYRYGTRARDVKRALWERRIYTPPLTLGVLPTLWRYTLQQGAEERLAFLYLYIDSVAELRRRLFKNRPDAEPADIAARIESAAEENRLAWELQVPLQFLNAELPQERVLREALRALARMGFTSPR